MFDSTLMMGGEMFPDEQSRRTALAPIVRYHFIPFAALVLHCASLLCIISSGILINVHTLGPFIRGKIRRLLNKT